MSSSRNVIKASQVRVDPFLYVVPVPSDAGPTAPFSELPSDIDDRSRRAAVQEMSAKMLREAQLKAEEIVRQAEQQAQAVMAQAREQGYAEGRRAGFEAGRGEGQAAGRSEWNEALAVMQRLIEAAHTYREQVIRATEPQIIALVLQIAEKVIGDALAHNPDLVQHVATNALAYVLPQEDLRIHLQPRDAETIRAAWAEALPTVLAGRHWEIVPNADLQPGDVVIEMPSGTVDARLRTQLERTGAALEAASGFADPSRGADA